MSSPFFVRPVRTFQQLTERIEDVADEFADILFPQYLYVGENTGLRGALESEVPGAKHLWPIPKRWQPEKENVDVIVIDMDLDYDALQALSNLTATVPTIFCIYRATDPIEIDSRPAPIVFLQQPSAQVLIPNILCMQKLSFTSVHLHAQLPLISSNDAYLSSLVNIFAAVSAGHSMVITADDIDHLVAINTWLSNTIEFPKAVTFRNSPLPTPDQPVPSSDMTTLFIYETNKRMTRSLKLFLATETDSQKIIFRLHSAKNDSNDDTEFSLIPDEYHHYDVPGFSERSDDAHQLSFYFAFVEAATSPPLFLTAEQIQDIVSENRTASTTTICALLRKAISNGTATSFTPTAPAFGRLLWDDLPIDRVFKLFEYSVTDKMIRLSNPRLVANYAKINIQTLYSRRQRTLSKLEHSKSIS